MEADGNKPRMSAGALPPENGNRLTAEELGLLAKQLAAGSGAIEAARIKERLTRGFYGD